MRIVILLFCFYNIATAQIAMPAHYPTLKPFHILDEFEDDLSFAYSFRTLISDYNGPLVRLRRASDNIEENFCAGENDIVDINLINTWRNGSKVYLVKWFDQSENKRDAEQTNPTNQPEFTPNAMQPFFKGDGNDFLTVINGNLQNVTNNGLEGTVFTLVNATNRSQFSFGVATGGNRWATHINWVNGLTYFDAAPTCCNDPRQFTNTANTWNYLTFVRETSMVRANKNGIEQFNGSNTRGRCTVTSNFGILYANGSTLYATTAYTEFILYKKQVEDEAIEKIETNAITFWEF